MKVTFQQTSLIWRPFPVVVLLLSAICSCHSVPIITTFDKVAVVQEGTLVNVPLSTITCSDDQGGITSTTIKSMSPNSPCTNCFEILDCGGDECLQYRAGVGTLSYSSAKSYLITISCDNNIDPPATEVIEIKVVPNSPPYFDPDVLHVDAPLDSGNSAGDVVYNVDAIDDENDDLKYSMKVVPSSSSSNYRIDELTGEIFTTVDMRKECRNSVTFEVMVSDGKNTAGPLIINSVINNANLAPVATNLDTIVMIPEDATNTAYKMNFVDPNGDTVTYTVTSTNTAGLAQYNIDTATNDINIVGALDYEQASLRRTDLVIKATDGFCESPAYTLRLEVADVNETPTIGPATSSIEVCEGEPAKEFDAGYTLIDPDSQDTVTWKLDDKMGGDGIKYNKYAINPETGALRTTVDYDRDQEFNSPTFNPTKTYVVNAIDKGKLTATATVTVTFLECNDNAPVFEQGFYGGVATECAAAGTVVNTARATDIDSDREGNNNIYFEGSGGSVSMGSGGQIIVNQAMPAGTVVTFKAYAWDRGQTPGPLRSVQPAVVSVRFTPCPTTPPPTTAGPTKAVTTTTTKATTTTSFTRQGEDNLAWIIIAALLGTFMLGLLTFMLWRYGNLCVRACSNLNCGKSCKGRRRPKPAKEEKIVRREPEKRRPATRPPQDEEEPEPEPAGPGFLFGFWKERYPDDDFKNMPDRKTLPTPGDMEAHYPHTIDSVDPPIQANGPTVPAADAPKKNCIVM